MNHLKHPIAIANWLFFVAFTVFIMIVIGGITRLTESGLSITEWKLIAGALPPLNQAAWISEFEKYKLIPEFIEINGPAGMGLAEFKFIYFWEWIHRFWGRMIGLVFAVPFAWFLLKGKLLIVTENEEKEVIAPFFSTSLGGTKKVVHAVEDCIFINVHPNPSNDKKLKNIEENIVVDNYKKYNKFLISTNKNKLKK